MADVTTIIIPEGLGTATVNDVMAGVTFTSDEGIRLVGTASGSDATEAVDAVFNADGSITETYENGKVVTTTFTAENQVVETSVFNGVETITTTTLTGDENGNAIETIAKGDTTIVKKITINEDGSVDEQIL